MLPKHFYKPEWPVANVTNPPTIATFKNADNKFQNPNYLSNESLNFKIPFKNVRWLFYKWGLLYRGLLGGGLSWEAFLGEAFFEGGQFVVTPAITPAFLDTSFHSVCKLSNDGKVYRV